MLQHLFGKSRSWIDPSVAARVEAAVRLAEQQTSGEIRVFTEQHCAYLDAVDRAIELFGQLGMHQTRQRNAVLIYWAVKDRQVAVYADQGIHDKLGSSYWNERVERMLPLFRASDPAMALEDCIGAVGEALKKYFPYDPGSDRNELSDTMMIGR